MFPWCYALEFILRKKLLGFPACYFYLVMAYSISYSTVLLSEVFSSCLVFETFLSPRTDSKTLRLGAILSNIVTSANDWQIFWVLKSELFLSLFFFQPRSFLSSWNTSKVSAYSLKAELLAAKVSSRISQLLLDNSLSSKCVLGHFGFAF